MKLKEKKLKTTILLGDSITELNPFKHDKVINLGVYGNTTRDIVSRINGISEFNCKKVILKVGINDILKGFSLKKSSQYYKEIFHVLEKHFKKIIVLSILPIEGRSKINMKVRKLNKIIEENAIVNNFNFIDLHYLFCDENLNLKNEYSVDGIHLSQKGYEILNGEILKLI